MNAHEGPSNVPARTATLANWQEAPYNRWGLTHARQLVPTAPIARADSEDEARPAVGLETIVSVLVDHQRSRLGAREYLEASFTDAILVMHGSTVTTEAYFGGNRRRSRHLLMSVSKSLCGLLVGRLVGDGILSLDRTGADYVPDLGASAFGTATLAQLLDMTVAVEYSEDYEDPGSHVRIQDRLAGWQPRQAGDPPSTPDFLRRLRANGRHGQRFQYCSAVTDALAWIVESVTHCTYPESLSAMLWQRMKVDDDAEITVEPGGFAFANGGISTTARDLAQAGRLILDDGFVGSTEVVPASWIRSIRSGGDVSAARGTVFQRVHPNGSYHNQWWVTGDDRGSLYAAGIHGQYLWVDPRRDVVIVKFSSLPIAVGEEWTRSHASFFRSVADTVT